MMMMMIIIVFLSIFNFEIIINYKNDDYYYYDNGHDDDGHDDAIVKIQTKLTQTKQIIFSFIFHFYIRNFIVDRHYSFIRVYVCVYVSLTHTKAIKQTTGNKMFFSFFLYKFIKFYRWYINLNGRWNQNEMGIWIEFFGFWWKKRTIKHSYPYRTNMSLIRWWWSINDRW